MTRDVSTSTLATVVGRGWRRSKGGRYITYAAGRCGGSRVSEDVDKGSVVVVGRVVVMEIGGPGRPQVEGGR